MIQSVAAALKQLKAAAEFLTSSLKITSKAVVTRVKIMTIKQTDPCCQFNWRGKG